MFNLLVSSSGLAWETDQLMRFDVSRFGEHSGTESNGIKLSSPASIKALAHIPTLLMYERGTEGLSANIVRYGYLKDITLSGQQIAFRFDSRGYFLRHVVEEFDSLLGISRFEHTRTHWAVKDGGLPSVFLDRMVPSPYGVKITEITRRGIVDALLLRPQSFHGLLDLMDFLKRVWSLSSMPSTDARFDNAEGDIWQHYVNNSDWDVNYLLFDYLGLKSCSDNVFFKFIETAVHPLVGDTNEVYQRINDINQYIEKDGFRLEQVRQVSGRPIYEIKSKQDSPLEEKHPYEVVLSFAGENRNYVSDVAAILKTHRVQVFYDRYEEATLWGKDLVEHLDKVYRSDARYCVMFVSKYYADKIWTNHERRSALARAVEDREEYILPARFDDTVIPGIRPTIGYVDLSRMDPEELARLILQKLGRVAEAGSK